MGESFSTHGYRILTSTLYPTKLHPLIDFIIYDPKQNEGKLMSEFIFESIFTSMMSHQNKLQEQDQNPIIESYFYIIKLPLKVYNLADQKTNKKILDLDISSIPNLQFIQSLISKI